ncbi:hypothetical protein [Lentilactobacillus kosonis]|nr:hypothetical protein [Lentilactobacillus kosonis]
MSITFPDEFLKGVQEEVVKQASQAVKQAEVKSGLPFWMKKKQAAVYMNVSDKTLDLFIADGLRTVVKGGVQRISKKSADEYYQQYEN